MSITYFVVIFGILLAKSLGFLRDIVFAGRFGAGAESDVYFGIFGVVTLVFTGIGISLSTLVIKNLNKAERGTDEEKRAYVSAFLRRVSVWLLAVTALLYLSAPQLVGILLPDLRRDMAPLAVKVTYIMLPSLFFVVIAYIISGVLQNSRVFFIPSVVSLPYNVLLISQLIFTEPDIIAVSIATTVGWGLHILFQLPSFYKCGYRFIYRRGKDRAGKPGSRADRGRDAVTSWRETAAIFVSNMVFQICFLFDRGLVSGSEGSVAAVNYASTLFVTVASVFVVAMSSVVFPAISKNYEEGKYDYVRRLIGSIINSMTVIFVPYLLVAAVFGRNIVSLLWERGNFDAEAASLTAGIFVIYSFGVFGYIAEELFSKVIYLSSKYVYTTASVAVVTVLKLVSGRFLYGVFGAFGVAVSTTVILTGYALFIAFAMKRVVGGFYTRKLAADAGRVLLSGLAALGVYFIFRLAMPGVCCDRVMFILPLLLCGVVYIGVLFATGLMRSMYRDMKTIREK